MGCNGYGGYGVMSWDMKPAILNRLVPKKGDFTSQLTGTSIKNRNHEDG